MRLWSIHPKYLDAKGLVALWREALLAKHALEGKTIGYRYHPQLIRFRQAGNPVACLNRYLSAVWEESKTRGYTFNRNKFGKDLGKETLTVTTGQIDFEVLHLLQKLRQRDPARLQTLAEETHYSLNPVFVVTEGNPEPWEKYLTGSLPGYKPVR